MQKPWGYLYKWTTLLQAKFLKPLSCYVARSLYGDRKSILKLSGQSDNEVDEGHEVDYTE
jgi:hypothetical protein